MSPRLASAMIGMCLGIEHPAHPEGLEEGEVRLVGADEVAGRVNDLLEKRGDVRMRHQLRVRVEADAKEAVVRLGGRPQFFGEHWGYAAGRVAPLGPDFARPSDLRFKWLPQSIL